MTTDCERKNCRWDFIDGNRPLISVEKPAGIEGSFWLCLTCAKQLRDAFHTDSVLVGRQAAIRAARAAMNCAIEALSRTLGKPGAVSTVNDALFELAQAMLQREADLYNSIKDWLSK